jgi:hypothetical protein
MRIDTTKLTGWKIATKTKPIKAKPLINLLVDRTVTNKFLVDALEGHEPLGDGSVICIGIEKEAWQQMPKKLLSKYNVVGIDKDGWMDCEPRPDNAVNCIKVTQEFIKPLISDANGVPVSKWDGKFTIIGQWGATVEGEKNVQNGVEGDYICQSQTDLTDFWIVKKKIFDNTYSIKS